MILIHSTNQFGIENVNNTQAAILIKVSRKTIGHWAKQYRVKSHGPWILYFNTSRLKRGMFATNKN